MVDLTIRVTECEAGEWTELAQVHLVKFIPKGSLWILSDMKLWYPTRMHCLCVKFSQTLTIQITTISYVRSVVEACDFTVDRDSTRCNDLSEWEYHWCISGTYNRLPSEKHIACSSHWEHLSLNYFTTLYLCHQAEYYERACGADRREEKCMQGSGGEHQGKDGIGWEGVD